MTSLQCSAFSSRDMICSPLTHYCILSIGQVVLYFIHGNLAHFLLFIFYDYLEFLNIIFIEAVNFFSTSYLKWLLLCRRENYWFLHVALVLVLIVLQLMVWGFFKVDYHIIYKERCSLFFPITYYTSFSPISFHWLESVECVE